MKGSYRIRFHFVGGSKTDQCFATEEERDACFEVRLDQLMKGKEKWLVLDTKAVNTMKLTHIEKIDKSKGGGKGEVNAKSMLSQC